MFLGKYRLGRRLVFSFAPRSQGPHGRVKNVLALRLAEILAGSTNFQRRTFLDKYGLVHNIQTRQKAFTIAPSSNGRTTDSGSVRRGSNPWGATNLPIGLFLREQADFVEVMAFGGFQRTTGELANLSTARVVLCCPRAQLRAQFLQPPSDGMTTPYTDKSSEISNLGAPYGT